MLLKIEGYGDEPNNMIAADFRYHRSGMDRYMNTRLTDTPDVSQPSTTHDSAFNDLISEIQDRLFKDRSAFYIMQLRDHYRQLLVD